MAIPGQGKVSSKVSIVLEWNQVILISLFMVWLRAGSKPYSPASLINVLSWQLFKIVTIDNIMHHEKEGLEIWQKIVK